MLVFAAKLHPQLAPLATSPAEAAGKKATAYEDLLVMPTGKLPDPKSLDNWVREEQGVKQWPPTMAFDIGQYLSNIDNVELRTWLEAEYKDQQAYSYFASGWMGVVEFSEVHEQSEYCFLRAESTPSQRVSAFRGKCGSRSTKDLEKYAVLFAHVLLGKLCTIIMLKFKPAQT